MPTFICEKCGRLDNSANTNNYWDAMGNKYTEQSGEPINPHYTSIITFVVHYAVRD